MTRHTNNGLRKLCDCGRKKWPGCRHAWYFSYKPRGGERYRFSLDAEIGERVKTKEEAVRIAGDFRTQINNGTFVRAAERRRKVVVEGTTVTQLGDVYFRDYRNRKTGKALSKNERYRWDLILRTEIDRTNGARVKFGDIDVSTVTRHDVEAFRTAHLVRRVETFTDSKGRAHTWQRGGPVGVNRCLGRLRAFYAWAVKEDHVSATPFKKGTEAVIVLAAEAKRERRLEPDVLDDKGNIKAEGEERRLLAVASPHLRALMIAALETGCRVGELLSLQWFQVRFDLSEIHLPAGKTKALRRREIPMSQQLRALLQMRKTDPEGEDYKPTDYVFGDVSGARIKSVKTAWENTVLKAHGIDPVRDRRTFRLSPECRAAFTRIDLNFHDLRREAGSRFLEHGMAAHYVQAFLDHANLSTTSRYLNITSQGMHAALERVEKSRGNLVANGTAATERSVSSEGGKTLN